MYKPTFPYLGNQALVSSGRVLIHSSDDFIFHFGKKGVAISSPATFTVDANEKTIIASPKIELGLEAGTEGEPVLLGNQTVKQLSDLCDKIKDLSNALIKLEAGRLEVAVPGIVATAKTLAYFSSEVKAQLEKNCKSKTTFTK